MSASREARAIVDLKRDLKRDAQAISDTGCEWNNLPTLTP